MAGETRLTGLPRCEGTTVMGVVNVTPDSFSDGGDWMDPGAAAAHGSDLAAAGAAIIDVGGESTRPGAGRVTAAEELRRVLPVITRLAAAGLCVSVDTMRAAVARAALDAGAAMINDVSGGLADPELVKVAAAAGVPYVVTHWRTPSADMYARAAYTDVVAEVAAELGQRVAAVLDAGVDPGQVIVDPGLGFAKRPVHNWALLGALGSLSRLPGHDTPFPLLVGASRKSFLGRLLAAPDGTPRPFAGTDDATVALTALAAAAGAWGVRVHAAAGNADAVAVAARWRAAGGQVRGPDRGELDRIAIRGLRAFGRHGVLAAERETGQEFVVDAVLGVDTRPAAAADDLTATADYGTLATQLAAIVAGPPADLIETLAQRLADACLADPAVREAEITVHKPHAPVTEHVSNISVTIRRGRA